MSETIEYVIIDDEIAGVNALQWEINETGIPCHMVASFTDAEDALRSIPQLKFDICFLDIEMPLMNGFELLAQLPKIPFDVIITTAYSQYAIDAFKLEALDYLLKPIGANELKHALLKHQKTKSNYQIIKKLETLFSSVKSTQQFKKISIPTQEGLEFVPFSNVIRLEAESNYTSIYTLTKKYVVAKTLKEYEEQLPTDQFMRIHRSHMVNIQYIAKYQRGKINCIVLDDGSVLPISNERKDSLKDFLEIG